MVQKEESVTSWFCLLLETHILRKTFNHGILVPEGPRSLVSGFPFVPSFQDLPFIIHIVFIGFNSTVPSFKTSVAGHSGGSLPFSCPHGQSSSWEHSSRLPSQSMGTLGSGSFSFKESTLAHSSPFTPSCL